MHISHIDHIGIAVKSMDETIPFYEKVLGVPCYGIEEVKDQQVRTAFFKVGDTKIELLEATGPDSPVCKFIEKKGEGLHHIAFATDNVGTALQEAGTSGIGLIDKVPRKGAENLAIGFLHPRSTFGTLIELCGER